ATAHTFQVGGNFSTLFASIRRVGHAAQFHVAPTAHTVALAREAEGLVDGRTDGVVAAHAEHLLFIGIRAQPARAILDEPRQLPTHARRQAFVAEVEIGRKLALVLLDGLALVAASQLIAGSRQPTPHVAHFLHAARITDGPI